MTLFTILTFLHVSAGIVAILCALIATLSKVLDAAHRLHIYSGRVFFWGMCVVCGTAVPMTIIHPNTFLFLIAFFSFYLVITGWRYAKNRSGIPSRIDWGISWGMIVISIAMIAYALFLMIRGNGGGITMALFGIIGAAMSSVDLKRMRRGKINGVNRITAHLTSMLAGTIAALTAFTVNNLSFEPGFVLWLAPTALITPIIVLWNRKLASGKRVQGMS